MQDRFFIYSYGFYGYGYRRIGRQWCRVVICDLYGQFDYLVLRDCYRLIGGNYTVFWVDLEQALVISL